MTPLDLPFLKELYNRCHPYEPLAPEDSRNIDLDGLGVRGVSWAGSLARRLVLSDTPQTLLVTGLPGSGKSTEFRRLAAMLGSGADPWLVVLADGEDLLDLTSPIDVPDILAGLVHRVEEEVLALEGLPKERALQDGYLGRLWTWLARTDVEWKGAQAQVPQVGSIVVEMKSRPDIRRRLRQTIAAHLPAFLEEVHSTLRELQERARARGKARLVVLYDSLEKLRGISTNWTDVLVSAEKVFSGGAPYLRLPVHVVYSVPPALSSRSLIHAAFLPMIKVRDRAGTPNAAGLDSARELIRRRVPDTALESLLGKGWEQRRDELIDLSGGYPRDLVRLLQNVVAAESHPLSQARFDQVLADLVDSYRRIVPREAFGFLAEVHAEKYLTAQDDAHRSVADSLVSNSIILRYQNEHDWFDLHPAVASVPGLVDARRRRWGGGEVP